MVWVGLGLEIGCKVFVDWVLGCNFLVFVLRRGF